MEDEFASFDGDHAVNINAEQFTKYRGAVDALHQVESGLNLLNAATPIKASKVVTDERYYSVSLPGKTKDSIPLSSTIPAPSSSSSSVKCPEKPFHLCAKDTLSLPKDLSFSQIQSIVERVLGGLSDYDWSFLPSDSSWKCKYFQGSNVREVTIKCFWDSSTSLHVIEVKRVRGDGLLSSSSTASDILDTLRAAFNQGQVEEKVVKKGGGGKLRGALPLPSSLKALAIPSKEQFLQGVQPVLKMASSPNFESRLEASRMLCDLAEKTPLSLLSLPECQDLFFQILDLLLHSSNPNEGGDEEVEIKQFSLMAFGLLADHDCYQECFLHFKDFDEMIRMIDNPPSASRSCECIQMRRQAARGMAKLVKRVTNPNAANPSLSLKLSLVKQFQSYGHLDEKAWKEHCQTIRDEKLQNYALQILPAFQ